MRDEPAADLGAGRYPADFLARYEPLECLSRRADSETLYVRDRVSGGFAVAKYYAGAALPSGRAEGGILRSLRHDGLPRFLGEYGDGAGLCVVREYVPGATLAERQEEAPLTEAEALSVLLRLCDILTYLHTRPRPVLHRDLKPQNIVLTGDGTVKLIDFGAARVTSDGAAADTVVCGTRAFAPPEQYGFAQTDCRADLYSLGVVMGYLLTGRTEPAAAASAIRNRRLARIYRRCTAFSPRERYPSAARLKAELLRADGTRRRTVLGVCAGAAACLLCLCAGFAAGRYTELLAPPPAGVVFAEPLIEQAVRVQLGRGTGEPVTEEDLLSVTELYVFGSGITAKTEEEMNRAADALFAQNAMRTGPIVSLADLAGMPNLQCVAVAMQQIGDLTPLSSLSQLRVAVVKNNPVADLSPLSGLKQLERLSLFGTLAEDFSPLRSCPRLTDLDAGGTLARSPAAFAGLDGLTCLSLYKLTLDTLGGIGDLPRLQTLRLGGVADGDLSPLLDLPVLETVLLSDSLREEAEKIAARAPFGLCFEP